MWATIYAVIKDLFTYLIKKNREPFSFKFEEEVVTYVEKMRTLQVDVVKVNAHDHTTGVRAEYAWVNHMYPGSKTETQAFLEKEFEVTGGGKKVVSFDVLYTELADGRKKSIYFEIDSFFAKGKPSSFEPGYIDRKLTELYT